MSHVTRLGNFNLIRLNYNGCCRERKVCLALADSCLRSWHSEKTGRSNQERAWVETGRLSIAPARPVDRSP